MREDVDRAGAPAARVTIVDVAHAAGVKPSTVSKALNDGRGSADVRRRVGEAAARLGYRPNQRARGLRRSESRSLGVLVPDLANPSFLPFLRGIEQAAQERGYVVLIADGQRSEDATGAALERFFDQGVDGLVLGGAVPPDVLRLYVEHGVPVAPAAASGSGPEPDVPYPWEGPEATATRAMGIRLLELGHRRFTFVTTPRQPGLVGRRYRRTRLGALWTVLRSAGADLSVAVVDPTRGPEECAAAFDAAVAAGSPTALVCANHLLAPGLLIALGDAGRRLPDDVSLVAYGDSDWARAYRPALSVIRRDTYAEGRHLAESLLDALAGAPAPPAPPVTAEYLERASCAPARPG